MKKISALLPLFLLLVLACKKEKKLSPGPEETPVQTGDLHVHVTTYDSLGNARDEHGGVRVLLQPGVSALTGENGQVTFAGIPHGVYSPALQKTDFDGAPQSINLSSASQTLNLPFAQVSPFRLIEQQALLHHRDSLTLQFRIEQPLPPGYSLKVAVLSSTLQNMSAASFGTVDIVGVSTNTLYNMNVAHLPGLRALVNRLDSNAGFYISAVPVSYGTIQTNFAAGTYLLGESRHYPGNILLKKNWK